METAREQLKEQKKYDNGRDRNRNFLYVFDKTAVGRKINQQYVLRIRDLGECLDRIIDVPDLEDHAEHEHRDDGSHAGKRDQTEGVVLSFFVAADRRDTDTERKDKRYGHRSRGHAARIERNRPKLGRNENTDDKRRDVEQYQQDRQPNAKHDTQHGDREKDAHAHRDGDNKQIVFDRSDLLGKNG